MNGSPEAIVTTGFGTPGSINLLVTMGFGTGGSPSPGAPTVEYDVILKPRAVTILLGDRSSNG